MFSIRGKSKNSYRSSEAKVLENVELRNLVAALGLSDGLDGLRYNRVIVASDADDDGMHIRMLLVTFFLKYYIDLIKAGHLYIGNPAFPCQDEEAESLLLQSGGKGRGSG